MRGALFATALAMAAAAPLAWVPAAAQPGEDASIEERRRYFTEDAVAPMVKPPGYDVTIVEYLDYQCPHCRTSHAPLMQLLARDKKVRVIFRDWPIFGPGSETAARAAIASKYQGKHLAMHDALMTAPLPLNYAVIRAAASKAGVDWARLQKDMAAHSGEIESLLARNEDQAETLGLRGTPTFLIGTTLTFGGMTLEDLQTRVAKAREGAR